MSCVAIVVALFWLRSWH